MPFVPVLLGTTREANKSSAVARAAHKLLQDQGADTQLLDIGDPLIPPLVERRRMLDQVHPAVEAHGQALERADALVVVVPEYNWGIPGVLKNALDHFLPELKRKPVGVIPVSAGGGGGRCALVQTRTVLSAMGMVVVPETCLIAQVHRLLDDDGEIGDPDTLAHMGRVVEQVLWWEHAARLRRALSDGSPGH